MRMQNKNISVVIAMSYSKLIPALITLTVVVALFSMTGCKKVNTSGTQREQTYSKAASAPYDLQFIDTMMAHHQSAIDMAKMAESKALHAELKKYALIVVEDQEREIAQMKQWRKQWYVDQPKAENMDLPGMRDSMKGMNMDHLKTMAGTDFDRMFLDMMIPHHQGAVTMAKDALLKSEHTEIKTLAQQIMDAQQKEIEMMNKWKTAWTGAN